MINMGDIETGDISKTCYACGKEMPPEEMYECCSCENWFCTDCYSNAQIGECGACGEYICKECSDDTLPCSDFCDGCSCEDCDSRDDCELSDWEDSDAEEDEEC
jgi:hypothetical protein